MSSSTFASRFYRYRWTGRILNPPRLNSHHASAHHERGTCRAAPFLVLGSRNHLEPSEQHRLFDDRAALLVLGHRDDDVVSADGDRAVLLGLSTCGKRDVLFDLPPISIELL